MQKNEITKLALKLMGIYILVKAILYIPIVISSFGMISQSNEAKVASVTLLITFVLLVILGIWITVNNKPTFEKEPISQLNLFPLGIVIAGIIIFSLAIADLPLLISKLVYISTIESPLEVIGANNTTENILALAGNLIQLLIGSLLFFKAKYFASLIK